MVIFPVVTTILKLNLISSVDQPTFEYHFWT